MVTLYCAADSNLNKLDRVQEKFLKLLDKKTDFPSLEARRKASAVGLTCKLLDEKGRGKLQGLKPVLVGENVKATRRSSRINPKPMHKYQVQNKINARKSIEIFRRSYRGRIPQIWNNLQNEILYDEKIESFQKHRKMLQKSLTEKISFSYS